MLLDGFIISSIMLSMFISVNRHLNLTSVDVIGVFILFYFMFLTGALTTRRYYGYKKKR